MKRVEKTDLDTITGGRRNRAPSYDRATAEAGAQMSYWWGLGTDNWRDKLRSAFGNTDDWLGMAREVAAARPGNRAAIRAEVVALGCELGVRQACRRAK